MKRLFVILITVCMLFGAAACGTKTLPPETDEPSEKPGNGEGTVQIVFQTDLTDGDCVQDETLSFNMSAEIENSDKVPTVSVRALGNTRIATTGSGTYCATLQAGENIIISEAVYGEQTATESYKIIYEKDSAPIVSTSLKGGLVQSDRFGFSVQAKDCENKPIAPSFKWIAGTPQGTPLTPNGTMEVGLWIGKDYLTKSGDSAENCEKYTDNTAVEEIAYVAWADGTTDNVYFKVNMPDSRPEFSGWFSVRCADENGNDYTVYVAVKYSYSDDETLALGTVTFSVEVFTLGGGYLIEPMQVPFYAGENNASLLTRVLGENGYSYDCTGKTDSSFYLSVIYNGDFSGVKYPIPDGVEPAHIKIPAAEPVFPECLVEKMIALGEIYGVEDLYDFGCAYGTYEDDGIEYLAGLGEFDYTSYSGWMYSVNGVFPGVGSSATMPNDGDVIRWQFTLSGYGADLGGGMTGEANYFAACDKSALTAKIAEINTMGNREEYGEAYRNAIEILQKLNATQEETDRILVELKK